VAEQGRSRHAQTLKAYDGEGFAGKRLVERGGAVYEFDTRGVRIERGGKSRFYAIDWLFGAGHFARTPVLRWGGQWVEQRLSWYAETGKLSLSPGHPLRPSSTFEESLGVRQSERNAERCFGCHKTGDRPGVHCESCHGAQGEHPAKAGIRRDRSVEACAVCHRSPLKEYASATPEVDDPMSIRFAPVGLMASRCYQKSAGRLDCVSCHDPHGKEKASGNHDGVCRSCHVERARPGECPRSANCAGCHMPKGKPAPYLEFTDHRIRRP